MARFNIPNIRKMSDLIFHEANSPYTGYDRADLTNATVTVAGADVLTLGTPVFRAKAATNGKWAPLKLAASLVIANEFALVIADGLGEQLDVSGAGDHNVTLLVRGPVMVKDAKVKSSATAIGLTVGADQLSLIHLLKAQGILAEITIA